MIPVEEIQQGSCFRKKQGTFAYLRISDSAAKAHKLDYETHVYGVAYNGNMTRVARGKPVVAVDISTMQENQKEEDDWDKKFGPPRTDCGRSEPRHVFIDLDSAKYSELYLHVFREQLTYGGSDVKATERLVVVEEGGFLNDNEPRMKVMTRDEFKKEYETDVPELFGD
jgi:hypothetical protein